MLRITQLPLLRCKPISRHAAADLVWTSSLGPADAQLSIIPCSLRALAPRLAAISAAPFVFFTSDNSTCIRQQGWRRGGEARRCGGGTGGRGRWWLA